MSKAIESAVERAEITLKAYRKEHGFGDYEEWIADLLADFMHFVDVLRTDREIGDEATFDYLLGVARTNYEYERAEADV